jgi:hypothetical protein
MYLLDICPRLYTLQYGSSAPLGWDGAVFDLAISRDYVMTDGHDILKVLNIKGNFT